MTDTTKQPAPKIDFRIANLPRPPAGPVVPDPAAPDPARLAADLGRSLQLSRAGALALTRLQLAIKSGDRHAAMAAMDRLHAVDADMERLVERQPAPAARDPARREWDAIARHIADEKLSLAFEKLAMVSEIAGPDMISPTSPLAPPDFGPPRSDRANAWPHRSPA
ncbi:MAG: hypothetical protein JF595_13510, partial [Sphingomonadales bacterium]|nr:hypothetical protein [Sphingomonadales bacterium]